MAVVLCPLGPIAGVAPENGQWLEGLGQTNGDTEVTA